MISVKPWISIVLISISGAVALGCSREKPRHLAPSASALTASQAPTGKLTQSFAVDTASSYVHFEMDAPVERIYGDASGSVSGDLHIDLKDLTRSTGLIKIDLLKMTLYQEKKKHGTFSQRKKNAKQNADARIWLQISSDAPAATRAKFRYAEFKITKLATAQKDVAALPGATRKVKANVTGEFLIHGHKTVQTAKLELTFQFSGDKATSVAVKSLAPINVDLEKNDIRPRQTWEKLAAKTLSALGQKVAGQAPVMIDFTANAK